MITLATCLVMLGTTDAPPDVSALWDGLREENPVIAWRTMRAMMRHQGCVEFLKKTLEHDQPIDGEVVDRLIASLNDEKFKVRAEAEKSLTELGRPVGPFLRSRLADKQDSIEMRRRMERILERIDSAPVPTDLLQKTRALEVLAGIDNDDARNLLDALAKGPKGSLLADAARITLQSARKRTK